MVIDENPSRTRREQLLQNDNMKILLNRLAMANSGFYLLYLTAPEDTELILSVIQEEVPKITQIPIEVNKYIPKTAPNYQELNAPAIGEIIGTPLYQWIDDIQIKRQDDNTTARLFVIDGSQIQQEDRMALVDHFALMNVRRDKICGNQRGPTLMVVPASLAIETGIAKYTDLMSCCHYSRIDLE